MQLQQILRIRNQPAAGVYLSITRRCPLACAHCATNSLIDSEEYSDALFTQFVGTFTNDNHPQIVLITGGEPLMRPELVRRLSESAHKTGAKVSLISGMFFVRHDTIPNAILAAIKKVDHFTASLDKFHEEEVPRSRVLEFLKGLVDSGTNVSIHLTAGAVDDDYVNEVIRDVRCRLCDRVPIFVARLRPTGRAEAWLTESNDPSFNMHLEPCSLATWPVVSFDGSIVACCNQKVVDGPAPKHLRLGNVLTDTWPQIRKKVEASTVLKALRVYGPRKLFASCGDVSASCNGDYCSTCRGLSSIDDLDAKLFADQGVKHLYALEDFVRSRLGSSPGYYVDQKYEHLVRLGAANSKSNGRLSEQ